MDVGENPKSRPATGSSVLLNDRGGEFKTQDILPPFLMMSTYNVLYIDLRKPTAPIFFE